MGIDSKPISQQRVYAQSTAPQGRDGILWVDTSDPTRPTYVYSSDTNDWESITPQFTQGIKDPVEYTESGTESIDINAGVLKLVNLDLQNGFITSCSISCDNNINLDIQVIYYQINEETIQEDHPNTRSYELEEPINKQVNGIRMYIKNTSDSIDLTDVEINYTVEMEENHIHTL